MDKGKLDYGLKYLIFYKLYFNGRRKVFGRTKVFSINIFILVGGLNIIFVKDMDNFIV